MRKRVIVGIFVITLVLPATYPLWKTGAKHRSKWFTIVSWILYDLRGRIPLLKSLPSSALEVHDPVTELHYINRTFRNYLYHAGITEQDLRGKRILELGPGTNIGVALLFLAAGVDHVLANDKYVPFRDSVAHRNLYRSLYAQLPPSQQENLGSALRIGSTLHLIPERLHYITGKSIEEFGHELPSDSFDLIVSNNVLEEIYNPDSAFAAMDRLLRPGGYMLHRVDFRDYGLLSNYGYHPLEFLTIPDSIYRWMAEATGQPNRRLLDYYRGKVTQLGYSGECRVTFVLGHASELPEPKLRLVYGIDYTHKELDQVRAIRGRLLPRFQRLSEEDLVVASIFLVARKPQ